jgi:Outer membrane protein beta-barrel domain
MNAIGKTLIGTAVALCAAGPAAAQGGYSGPYIGIAAYYGRAAIDATVVRPPDVVRGGTIENGFTGAGTLGYDWKFNGLVVGVASDIAATKFGDNTGGIATFRGRAGVLVTPATLLYATGGLAYLKNDLSGRLGGNPYSLTGWVPGWVVGGGVEQRYVWGTQPVRLGLEVDYVKINDRHISVPGRDATLETRSWSVGTRLSFELNR